MTPYELVAASVTDLHRDFPRRATRSLQWTEDKEIELRALRAKVKNLGRLSIHNGGGMLVLMGGLDYLMEVIRTDDYCYTLLM
jgi:hypothetical protein